MAFSYTFNATSYVKFFTNVTPTRIVPKSFHPAAGKVFLEGNPTLITEEGFYHFGFWKELHTEWLHWVGFIILSWIYGWVMILVAIADELIQFFIPGRAMDIKDMLRNLGGVSIGLTFRYIIRWWKDR